MFAVLRLNAFCCAKPAGQVKLADYSEGTNR
jgi:hypothetical protein